MVMEVMMVEVMMVELDSGGWEGVIVNLMEVMLEVGTRRD